MNREAFEAEARKHGFILDRLDKSGEYVQLITEQAWLMWQAATDAALSAPATVPDAMTRAILEQALEVLEGIHRLDEYPEIQPAIDAIRALKEQP